MASSSESELDDELDEQLAEARLAEVRARLEHRPTVDEWYVKFNKPTASHPPAPMAPMGVEAEFDYNKWFNKIADLTSVERGIRNRIFAHTLGSDDDPCLWAAAIAFRSPIDIYEAARVPDPGKPTVLYEKLHKSFDDPRAARLYLRKWRFAKAHNIWLEDEYNETMKAHLEMWRKEGPKYRGARTPHKTYKFLGFEGEEEDEVEAIYYHWPCEAKEPYLFSDPQVRPPADYEGTFKVPLELKNLSGKKLSLITHLNQCWGMTMRRRMAPFMNVRKVI